MIKSKATRYVNYYTIFKKLFKINDIDIKKISLKKKTI